MMRTKNQLRIVCGLAIGRVELRRASDLGLISHFGAHSDVVTSICELHDGSFVTASYDTLLKRWSEAGTALQTYVGHTNWVFRVVELKPDVIASSGGDGTVKVWKASTKDLLHTLNVSDSDDVCGLVALGDGLLASGSRTSAEHTGVYDGSICVWSEEGEQLETVSVGWPIGAMTRLHRDGFIVSTNGTTVDIRKLSVYSHRLSLSLSLSSLSPYSSRRLSSQSLIDDLLLVTLTTCFHIQVMLSSI